MRLFIDADGCPVVDIAVKTAQKFGIDCFIVCDTAHVFHRPPAQTITVSQGADSVDFALVNRLKEKDIAITQDYALAAMCLSKKALVLSQDGLVYHEGNIDALLMSRHMAQKIRRSGGRLKGCAKRTAAQDAAFRQTLEQMIQQRGGLDTSL